MRQIKTDRSLIMYILLSIVTCGIYQLFFIHSIAEDVNEMCEGDGKHTNGLLMYILLSVVTCGIYVFVWHYGIANRLADNAPKYGIYFSESGTTVLLWMLLGGFICGLLTYVGINIIIENTNALAAAYNEKKLGFN